MSAYVLIIRDETKDPVGMENYRAIAKDVPTLKMDILVSKSCNFKVLEGSEPESIVVMHFPSVDDALEWYQSEAYQEALPHRIAAANTRVIIAEGLD